MPKLLKKGLTVLWVLFGLFIGLMPAKIKLFFNEKFDDSANLKAISDHKLIEDLKSLALYERKIQKQIIKFLIKE